MNDRIFDRNIYFDIATYDKLSEKNIELMNIFNALLEEIVFQYERPLAIQTEKKNGRQKIYRFTKINWDKICDMILKDEMQYIYLFNDPDTNDEFKYYNPAIALSVTCDYNFERKNYGSSELVANSIAFSISERLIGKIIPEEIQNKIVNLFKELFTAINGTTGYLSYDFFYASWSPQASLLEGLLDLNYYSHSHNFKELARGYYWGNIISEGHIKKLGGLDFIKKQAPCYKVEEIKFNNKKSLYLQLTPDISNYSDDTLKELKRFFKPILPEEDMNKINESEKRGMSRKYGRLVFD